MKRKRTARQLTEVITNMLGSSDVRPEVYKDPVYGFHAMVYRGDPAVVHAAQLAVERLLPKLREVYELDGQLNPQKSVT